MKASVRGKSKEGVLLFIGVQARHADRVTLSRDLNEERAGALNISSVCLAGRTASAKALAGACLRCSSLGEGNGTPLQHFCLENPMDGGAWWAAVHGVARVGHD